MWKFMIFRFIKMCQARSRHIVSLILDPRMSQIIKIQSVSQERKSKNDCPLFTLAGTHIFCKWKELPHPTCEHWIREVRCEIHLEKNQFHLERICWKLSATSGRYVVSYLKCMVSILWYCYDKEWLCVYVCLCVMFIPYFWFLSSLAFRVGVWVRGCC